jgi:tetratricopeptide (TPR) repeat protein
LSIRLTNGGSGLTSDSGNFEIGLRVDFEIGDEIVFYLEKGKEEEKWFIQSPDEGRTFVPKSATIYIKLGPRGLRTLLSDRNFVKALLQGVSGELIVYAKSLMAPLESQIIRNKHQEFTLFRYEESSPTWLNSNRKWIARGKRGSLWFYSGDNPNHLQVTFRSNSTSLKSRSTIHLVSQEIVSGAPGKLSPTETVNNYLKRKAVYLGFSVEQLRSAISEWGNNVKTPYEEGLAALYGNHYEKASKHIRDSMRSSDNKTSKKYLALASAEYMRGHYESAESSLREAQAINPKDSLVLHSLGVVLEAEGKHGESETLIKESLLIQKKALGTEHPDLAPVLNNLAGIHYAQGQFKKAKTIYEQALEVTNESSLSSQLNKATVADNLANTLDKLGRGDDAKAFRDQAETARQKVRELITTRKNVEEEPSSIPPVPPEPKPELECVQEDGIKTSDCGHLCLSAALTEGGAPITSQLTVYAPNAEGTGSGKQIDYFTRKSQTFLLPAGQYYYSASTQYTRAHGGPVTVQAGELVQKQITLNLKTAVGIWILRRKFSFALGNYVGCGSNGGGCSGRPRRNATKMRLSILRQRAAHPNCSAVA